MTQEKVQLVIAKAIQDAFIDHPSAGHGKTWDQVYKSSEESEHLARAVLFAMDKAGFVVGLKDLE